MDSNLKTYICLLKYLIFQMVPY